MLPSCTGVPRVASISALAPRRPPAKAILGQSLRLRNFLAHFLLPQLGQLCPQPPPRGATDNPTFHQWERYLRPQGEATSLTQARRPAPGLSPQRTPHSPKLFSCSPGWKVRSGAGVG